MPTWSTSCVDWEHRIVARESLITFPPLFPDEAEAALAVFKSLRVVDLPGQPTFGEVCDEWVFDFVRAIFGAYDAANAQRLISEFFLLISKKNGKSTIAAGIMLTALIRNWRHSAELLILAPTIEIANNSFFPARDMVRADRELTDLLHVQENIRQITHRITKAYLRVVAADTEVVGGKKAAFVLVDELWLFGKRANADAMLREATGGLVARPEGFVIFLSTQSDAPPAGVFKEKLDLYRGIRDGEIVDTKRLGVLFEFPKAMIERNDHLKPENFYITNPAIDRAISRAKLESMLIDAQRGSREGLVLHLSKHLNVEIGAGFKNNAWPGAAYWPKRRDPELSALRDFDALLALLDRCEICVIGVDGGGLDDLFGLTALGREKVETEIAVKTRDGKTTMRRVKRWLSWSHAWCHEGVLELRKSIAPRLRDFADEGDLTIVGDELSDMSDIVEIVQTVLDAGLLGKVAVDPAGLGGFVEALRAIDVTVESGRLMGVGQGFRLMNAIKTAERQLAAGLWWHAGGGLMDWCVGNVKIEPLATAIRATKANAGDAKIDPWAAAMNAVEAMGTDPTVATSVIRSDYRLQVWG